MEDEMNELVAALEKKIGLLSLFVTLGTEENPSSMLSLIVSAVGLDHAANQDAVKLIISCLKENASDEIQNSIARVNVRSTTDPLVQAIIGAIRVDSGPAIIQNLTINGVHIAYGSVYKSVRFDRPKPKF